MFSFFKWISSFFKRKEKEEEPLALIPLQIPEPIRPLQDLFVHPVEGQFLMYDGENCYRTGYVYKVYDQYYVVAINNGDLKRVGYDIEDNTSITLITRGGIPVIASKQLITEIDAAVFSNRTKYEDEAVDKIEENRHKMEIMEPESEPEPKSEDIDEIEEIREGGE